MIRQLGAAQLFQTLSAAETRWVHLLKILSEIVGNVTLTDEQVNHMIWSHKCRLISSDPVTCARHFDYSIQHYFNDFLKSDVSPFGQLKDFWYRIEFQHRGSPHLHYLLWIADVPQWARSFSMPGIARFNPGLYQAVLFQQLVKKCRVLFLARFNPGKPNF